MFKIDKNKNEIVEELFLNTKTQFVLESDRSFILSSVVVFSVLLKILVSFYFKLNLIDNGMYLGFKGYIYTFFNTPFLSVAVALFYYTFILELVYFIKVKDNLNLDKKELLSFLTGLFASVFSVIIMIFVFKFKIAKLILITIVLLFFVARVNFKLYMSSDRKDGWYGKWLS